MNIFKKYKKQQKKKLHVFFSLDKSYLKKAKETVESWPEWKQKCPYSTSSDQTLRD